MLTKRLAIVLALLLLLAGCNTMRRILGVQVQNDPSVEIKSAEARWLLIKNPRFGEVPSEPEYVWVEEDKVPTTLKTLVRGKGAIIAPPEIVAKYGQPPGGGKISPRQGVPYQASPEPTRPARAERNGNVAGNVAPAALSAPTPIAAPRPKRGYVVHVETSRIVIDLTAADGLQPGSVVSFRRDRIPIVHPVTGEVLGELDEEVGTARVTETREKFSVTEVQTLAPGAEVQVKDRVVPK